VKTERLEDGARWHNEQEAERLTGAGVQSGGTSRATQQQRSAAGRGSTGRAARGHTARTQAHADRGARKQSLPTALYPGHTAIGSAATRGAETTNQAVPPCPLFGLSTHAWPPVRAHGVGLEQR